MVLSSLALGVLFSVPNLLQLPPSLLRSRWVADQFTPTVPPFASVAYSVELSLESERFGEGREPATHKPTTNPDIAQNRTARS